MKIGVIREGKVPPDSRVPLVPNQCAQIMKDFDVEIVVQPSPIRIFKDEEYTAAGVTLQEDLSDCDLLLGVKEVRKQDLLANKRYCFFSHTIKEQPYNRNLLLKILEKNIHLLDYEVFTDENHKRLIAFGYFAGIVGAHNGIWTYGQRTKSFSLKRMNQYFDYAAAVEDYKKLELPAIKVVLTGTGRVSSGSAKVLEDMGIERVSPQDFLTKEYSHAVFTQLKSTDYVRPKDGSEFTSSKQFYDNPTDFESNFEAYTKVAHMMINGIFWDNDAPAFFTREQMATPDFKIEVIADVTCDIAPVASIPATIKASTIADPVFGYDPTTGEEVAPYQLDKIDMMTIDNLPSELPRDASASFGNQFIEHILPEFFKENSGVIERASVAVDGELGPHFAYLEDYVAGVK